MNTKLLDTGNANTKLSKTNKTHSKSLLEYLSNSMQRKVSDFRLAGLSLAPSNWACPASRAADCQRSCLMSAGRGRFKGVKTARERKRDWLKNDPTSFLTKLRKELNNFSQLCMRTKKQPIVRLNVISDIVWEHSKYSIPQEFPDIMFYDYTKLSKRLGNTPDNYHLMFSWSGAAAYQPSVQRALSTSYPISAVFDMEFPKTFLNRTVTNGDQSDLNNLLNTNSIIGLKAKGKAKGSNEPFVLNTNNITQYSILRAA